MDQLGIANLALGWLNVAPLTSLDDPSSVARKIKAAFDGLRDSVLEDRDWSFATARLSLSLDAVAPPATWAGRYEIPGKVLRVLRAWESSATGLAAISMTSGDEADASELQWQVEAGYANADGTGEVKRYVVAATTANPLNVKALLRIEDAGLWSPSFCQAVAARIAADLALPITGKAEMQGTMWALYEKKLQDAAANDGRQGAPLRFQSHWIRDRRR